MKNKIVDINFLDILEQNDYEELINNVLTKAFKEEGLDEINMYVNVILTNPKNIKETNKKFRNIDRETDVLSFPMFERNEIDAIIKEEQKFQVQEVLGDIMISIQRVEQQAKEYGHSFERELAYMLIHGFYHLMGYDHMNEEEKKEMRAKEEKVLNLLNIQR